jgi:hypothetical protein
MTPETIKLHAQLIRAMRGVINAWEEWVFTKLPQQKTEENPDPKQHFEKIQTRR